MLVQDTLAHLPENGSRRIPYDAWKVVRDFLDRMLPAVGMRDHLGAFRRARRKQAVEICETTTSGASVNDGSVDYDGVCFGNG